MAAIYDISEAVSSRTFGNSKKENVIDIPLQDAF